MTMHPNGVLFCNALHGMHWDDKASHQQAASSLRVFIGVFRVADTIWLWLTVSHGKSPCLIGKPSVNGPFSMAMLNNQRVQPPTWSSATPAGNGGKCGNGRETGANWHESGGKPRTTDFQEWQVEFFVVLENVQFEKYCCFKLVKLLTAWYHITAWDSKQPGQNPFRRKKCLGQNAFAEMSAQAENMETGSSSYNMCWKALEQSHTTIQDRNRAMKSLLQCACQQVAGKWT